MTNKLPEESWVKNFAAKPSLRPVDYTPETGNTICDRLFDGETLSQICRDAAMPDKPTVMRWLAQYAKFLDEYVFTCQLLAEDLAANQPRRQCGHCRKQVRGANVVPSLAARSSPAVAARV
jgi:hypothetical protein